MYLFVNVYPKTVLIEPPFFPSTASKRGRNCFIALQSARRNYPFNLLFLFLCKAILRYLVLALTSFRKQFQRRRAVAVPGLST